MKILILDEVMMVEVSKVEVTNDSLLCIPSSVLTCVSLSDKLTGMFGVRTSSIFGLICEALDGMAIVFSGMEVGG